MEYTRKENTIALRLDRGEDIFKSIALVAKKENIKSASITGIGATNHVRIGTFESDKKKYDETILDGNFEICNLSGSLSLKDGEVYPHLHIVVAGNKGVTYGGHLFEAIISLTCEIYISNINTIDINREYNESVGINTWRF